jgi:hypothetical protein
VATEMGCTTFTPRCVAHKLELVDQLKTRMQQSWAMVNDALLRGR